MYELITGRLPFKGDTAVEIAIKQMKEQIPSVCQFNESIPQSVENIILRACAKNPKNRYENVIEMYEDLQTCLKPERMNERRLVYRYPEHETEETNKVDPKLSREEKNHNIEEEIEEVKVKKKPKVLTIILAIVLGITALVIIVLAAIALLYPKTSKVKDITIPKNIVGLTESEAANELTELGLDVDVDLIEEHSDEYEEGKIIGTRPAIGRKVKEGSKVQLIISSGTDAITLDDYKDKDCQVIKELLNKEGISVTCEKQDVDDITKYTENQILSQDKPKGEKVKKGDSVVFKVPNMAIKYPDFLSENYTLDGVKAFCEENDISLKVTEEETDKYTPGAIFYQSRNAGTLVKSGVTLTVKVAKAVTKTEEEPKEDTTE